MHKCDQILVKNVMILTLPDRLHFQIHLTNFMHSPQKHHADEVLIRNLVRCQHFIAATIFNFVPVVILASSSIRINFCSFVFVRADSAFYSLLMIFFSCVINSRVLNCFKVEYLNSLF